MVCYMGQCDIGTNKFAQLVSEAQTLKMYSLHVKCIRQWHFCQNWFLKTAIHYMCNGSYLKSENIKYVVFRFPWYRVKNYWAKLLQIYKHFVSERQKLHVAYFFVRSTLLCEYGFKSLEFMGKNFVTFFQRNCLMYL